MMAYLDVSRAELLEALRVLERTTRPGKRGRLVLSFADGDLVLELAGAGSSATATGEWDGTAQVDSDALLRLRHTFPAGDPVQLRVEDDQLKVGTLSVGCSWSSNQGERVPTALNASQLDLLALPLHYTREQIERSGVADLVASSEALRDELLAKAHRVLGPLGISEEDLRGLVQKRVQGRAPVHLGTRAVQRELHLPREGELELE